MSRQDVESARQIHSIFPTSYFHISIFSIQGLLDPSILRNRKRSSHPYNKNVTAFAIFIPSFHFCTSYSFHLSLSQLDERLSRNSCFFCLFFNRYTYAWKHLGVKKISHEKKEESSWKDWKSEWLIFSELFTWESILDSPITDKNRRAPLTYSNTQNLRWITRGILGSDPSWIRTWIPR